MVHQSEAQLDRIFAALADPTRRALVARLAAEPALSVSALAKPLPMSLPAVMKHLDVLENAGLVAREKREWMCRSQVSSMAATLAGCFAV